MPNEDHRVTAPPSKGPVAFWYAWIFMAMLIVVGLAIAAFVVSKDDRAAKASGVPVVDPPPTSASPLTTSVDEQTELVSRLREILAIREQAYHKRNPELLKEIYAEDCPCLGVPVQQRFLTSTNLRRSVTCAPARLSSGDPLASDTNAIHELISANYIWIGGEASIRVRRTERVTARMWMVIADFSSEPLRVETQSGRLIRSEPRGRDLFQFVLAKPAGSTQWLLGRASSYKDG
jgi:hypothetical protein